MLDIIPHSSAFCKYFEKKLQIFYFFAWHNITLYATHLLIVFYSHIDQKMLGRSVVDVEDIFEL